MSKDTRDPLPLTSVQEILEELNKVHRLYKHILVGGDTACHEESTNSGKVVRYKDLDNIPLLSIPTELLKDYQDNNN